MWEMGLRMWEMYHRMQLYANTDCVYTMAIVFLGKVYIGYSLTYRSRITFARIPSKFSKYHPIPFLATLLEAFEKIEVLLRKFFSYYFHILSAFICNIARYIKIQETRPSIWWAFERQHQSCPQVTFLGPGLAKRWPDPRLPTKSLTRPDLRPDPSPICKFFNWIIMLLIIQLLYIKYCRKSINLNVVFEDLYRFRYQEIISKKLKKKSEVLTRPAKIRQNRDPTWPDPTRGSIRPMDNSGQHSTAYIAGFCC